MTDTPITRPAPIDGQIPAGAMDMDEFLRRQAEAPFELYAGAIIPKMPQIFLHGLMSKRLYDLLHHFEMLGIGLVFNEMTFVMTDNPRSVRGSRIPDVMFVLQATVDAFLNSLPDAREKPAIFVPEFVIEVMSPTDTLTQLLDKAAAYLTDGVQLVWIVDPHAKQVHVVRHDQPTPHTASNGEITGAPVLPTFTVTLESLFA
ncbi:MAG: Uma2 family endonuclease [bacterium]|nr:Uma2 family endonuclease [bacterium]